MGWGTDIKLAKPCGCYTKYEFCKLTDSFTCKIHQEEMKRQEEECKKEIDEFQNDVKDMQLNLVPIRNYSNIIKHEWLGVDIKMFKPTKYKNKCCVCKNRVDEYINRGLYEKYGCNLSPYRVRQTIHWINTHPQ
jgi:tmRNA-binding protein